MDILNWLYMKTNGLVKTKANNAQTDLVALGANVGFNKRGDEYQTYSMPLADAVAAGCKANNSYYTGIYDVFPFIITPSMVNSCLTVIDTPATPTFFPSNLEARKIFGIVDLSNNTDSIYLGTVEASNVNFAFAIFGPAKVTGAVDTYDGNAQLQIESAFGVGALVQDTSTEALVPFLSMNLAVDNYAPDSFDLYLTWEADTVNDISGSIAFEYEFFVTEGSQVTFTIY